jgi:predicted MFS family arabinose efflux permease
MSSAKLSAPSVRDKPTPVNVNLAIAVVALVQLVNVIDFMMVMPLGPDFARSLQINPSYIGIIGGSYTLAAALAGIFGAQFLDRFDRKRALFVALLGLAIATIAGGLSFDLWSLVASRVMAGAFGGPATALSLAIITDLVPPHRRGRAMGIASAAFPVASVFGVPAGLALARIGGWHTPFFAIGTLSFVVLMLVKFILPTMRSHLDIAPADRVKRSPGWHFFKRPQMRNVLLSVAFMTTSSFMLVPNISLYLQGNLAVPRENIEWMYLIGGIAAFSMLMLAGRVVDRFGSAPMAFAGSGMMLSAVATGFLTSPALLPIPVFFAMFMASGSMRQVPLQALASKLPAPDERAQFMSMMSATSHLMSSVGAFVASQILIGHVSGAGDDKMTTFENMPLVACLTIVTGIPVAFFLWRVERTLQLTASKSN